MILIPTSEIKTFLKRSSKIDGTKSLIPVLSYIKLDCSGDTATISKTDMATWCIHQIEADFKPNETLLIDERILNAVISNGADDLVSISRDGNDVLVKSGKATAGFAWQDPQIFPEPPAMNQGNGITDLPAEILYSIRAAASIINDDSPTSYSLCHLRYIDGKSNIMSTNSGAIAYMKRFDARMPKLSIVPLAASMICSFETVRHYELGNYDFFDCGKTVFGFIKSEYNPPANFTKIFTSKTDNYFEVSKAELLQFCSLTTNIGDKFPTAKFYDGGMLGVIFSYHDNDLRLSTRTEMAADKNFTIPDFSFSPKLVMLLAKAVNGSLIRFSPADRQNMYYIYSTEEPELLTIIAGNHPQTNK